jgi:2Fe-2S ferredoxin
VPRLNFRSPDGSETPVDAFSGYTVMEAAMVKEVPGIKAECGGACACATCHIYVDAAWVDKINPMDEYEDAMLESALDRRENSRLACQIEITDAMDGFKAVVADND